MKTKKTSNKTNISNTIIDKTTAKAIVPPDVFQKRHKTITMAAAVETTAQTPQTTKPKELSVAEKATNRVIELIEQGNPLWRRTWGTYGLAQNFVTKNVYQGINFLMLNMISPYSIPYYLTFSQLKKLGGKVKKGSKAERVYYYNWYYKDENGNNISEEEAEFRKQNNQPFKVLRFIKSYPVFNIECTEGFDWKGPKEVNRPNNPIEECEVILQEIPEQPVFKTIDANKAMYNPTLDIVNLPKLAQFENSELFYRTTFHELLHWTGHEKRLARKGIMEFAGNQTDIYAEEELIAELGSNILMNIVGISNEDTQNVSAGYLKSWVERLRKDPKFLFKVAPKAQAGAEFILGKKLSELYV